MFNNTYHYVSSTELDYATKFTIDPSFYDDLPLLKNYKGKIPLSEEWEGYTIKTELKSGKMNGFTELYDKQGHLREQMTLIDDKRNGEYSKWDKDGELLHKGNFKDDIEIEVIYKKDDSTVINMNDIKVDNGTSEDNHTTSFQSNMNGTIVDYDNKSNIMKRENYEYIKDENGSIREIYDKVNKRTVKTFENKTMRCFGSDGRLLYEGGYKDSIDDDYPYDGDGVIYDEEGIKYLGSFVNGLYHDRGVIFRHNRKIFDGQFVNGIPNGRGEYYDENNSKVIANGFWKDGVYYDESGGTIQYQNGDFIIKGKFASNEPENILPPKQVNNQSDPNNQIHNETGRRERSYCLDEDCLIFTKKLIACWLSTAVWICGAIIYIMLFNYCSNLSQQILLIIQIMLCFLLAMLSLNTLIIETLLTSVIQTGWVYFCVTLLFSDTFNLNIPLAYHVNAIIWGIINGICTLLFYCAFPDYDPDHN